MYVIATVKAHTRTYVLFHAISVEVSADRQRKFEANNARTATAAAVAEG